MTTNKTHSKGQMMNDHNHDDADNDDQELIQRKEDEILALEAILPPDYIKIHKSDEHGKEFSIEFTIPITLEKSNKVKIRSHIFTKGQENKGLLDVNKQFASLSTIDKHQNVSKSVQNGENLPQSMPTMNDRSGYQTKETILDNISHLPPIQIRVNLPRQYPKIKPEILSITSDFIGNISIQVDRSKTQNHPSYGIASSRAAMYRFKLVQWIRSKLNKAWEDMPGEILYFWYEILRETLWSERDTILQDGAWKDGLVLDEFIVRRDDDLLNTSSTSSGLAAIIRSHDLICKRKEFEGERYGCGICLEDIRGEKCWKLSCKHVFCQHCLSEYVSRSILDGYCRQATACPDPECVKTRVQAENNVVDVALAIDSDPLSVHNDLVSPQQPLQETQSGVITEEEIVSLVGSKLLDRLHELQEKALALRDPSFGFCPRPGCEHLIRGDPKDKGTAYEAMRQCSACSYTYCVYCSKAWHYGNPCNIISSTALIEAYQSTAEGSMERKAMEMKYGKSNLERMVRTYEEEKSNREWIEANTQKCPCCHVNITKSFGCNHMACKACNTHFCYRCGTRLPPNEPYRHFNTAGTSCYMKLFDADMTQGGGGGWEFVDDIEEEEEAWERENL